MDVNINCTHIYYEWQYHLQSAYSSHSCQVSHLICRSLLQELFWNMWCLVSVLRHIKGKRKTVQTQSSLTFDTRFTGLLSAAGAWCAVNVKQGFVFFLFYDYYYFFVWCHPGWVAESWTLTLTEALVVVLGSFVTAWMSRRFILGVILVALPNM